MVIDGGTFDDKHHLRGFGQRLLLNASFAQPFSTSALEKFKVVGIEDDAAGIGVFVINP